MAGVEPIPTETWLARKELAVNGAEMVVAPATATVPAMIVFPVWFPTKNLSDPTVKSPDDVTFPLEVIEEAIKSDTVVVPVTPTFPENTASLVP